MPSEIRIELEKPIALRDQTIVAIQLRSPTLTELHEIGLPVECVNCEGGWKERVHWNRVGELISNCVVAPTDAPAWIGQLGLADTYKLAAPIARFWIATLIAAAEMRDISINKPLKMEQS